MILSDWLRKCWALPRIFREERRGISEDCYMKDVTVVVRNVASSDAEGLNGRPPVVYSKELNYPK